MEDEVVRAPQCYCGKISALKENDTGHRILMKMTVMLLDVLIQTCDDTFAKYNSVSILFSVISESRRASDVCTYESQTLRNDSAILVYVL
jgi:hypothetical protein